MPVNRRLLARSAETRAGRARAYAGETRCRVSLRVRMCLQQSRTEQSTETRIGRASCLWQGPVAPGYIMRARAHLTSIAVRQANASRLRGFTVSSAPECKSGDKSIPLEPPLELHEYQSRQNVSKLLLCFYFLKCKPRLCFVSCDVVSFALSPPHPILFCFFFFSHFSTFA